MSDQITKHAVPTGVWRADRVHSTVGFAVPYMAGTFQGTFSEFDAQLSDGVLRGTAEVASVQVKDPNLEAHLQAPDFFDADRYPQLSRRDQGPRQRPGARSLWRRALRAAAGDRSRPHQVRDQLEQPAAERGPGTGE